LGSSDEILELEPLETELTILGIKTIVFAGIYVESAIYDYAAIQLGDNFVSALKCLIKSRNYIVHHSTS